MRKVLFLCIGNSCRSQMAEGWLRHLAPDRFEAHSAGVMPCYVNEDAIRVMSEVGIDISQQRSKHVSEYDGQHFPFVITVCDPAKTACPVFAGETHREHWPVEDPGMFTAPEEHRIAFFREIRDEIGDRVRGFIEKSGR
jgi:arsenate reductase